MKWQNDIYENVRSGLVELLILQLLCERDMYGYEIRQFLYRNEQAYCENADFELIKATLENINRL